MPKAAQTGREKKTKRLFLKGAREREKADIQSYKQSSRELDKLAKGEGILSRDPSKILEAMQSTKGLTESYFKPYQEEALAKYQQEIVPQLASRFGSDAGSSSSALNQALSASAQNLQRQLTADFSRLQLGLGEDLMNRQQNAELMRFNALQAGMRQQGSLGQNVAVQPSYLPKTQGPERGKGAISGALQGGLTGFMAGGPWGALLGAGIGATTGYLGAGQSSGQAGQMGASALNQYMQGASTQSNPWASNVALQNARVIG